ncbi:hypothetical protein MHYP_G00349920 [Metynnis hypsauchen]
MMENCDLHAKMRLCPKKARTPLFQLTRDIVREHLAEEQQKSELEAQLRAQKQKKRAERQVTRERGRKAKEDDNTLEEMTETLSSRREGELLLEKERLRDQLKAKRNTLRSSGAFTRNSYTCGLFTCGYYGDGVRPVKEARRFRTVKIRRGGRKTRIKSALVFIAYELSSFGFFQKSSIQEFMTFTCGLIVERSGFGTRASVSEKEYMCHMQIRDDGLSAVVIADSEYPQRICFSLLDKVLDEFSRQVDDRQWPTGTPETIRFTALEEYLNKYQNPREADALTRVQAEVDETKIILHRTMESLLDRGEKLDDLVQKSEELGQTSKAFYKTARKQNRCCKMM